MSAEVFFNWERDAAAIRWDRRPNDLPLNAVNQALAVLYGNEEPINFYLYEVYNGPDCLGLLCAGNFNPDSDTEIRAIWDAVIEENRQAAHGGELAPIVGIEV